MFSGAQPNPYEDIVLKTTDENLTSENWELILNLCDKVQEEGEAGARNVIAAALKRLAHRNPNVQLYALALVEALSKNCGVEVHREIASRSFTQGLEKLISDRNTHDKVRRKALSLIAMWTGEFEKDPTLGVMEDCYNTLKAKNYKFEETIEAPPPQVDDEIRRKEEEELQRVLEMSVHDKGGRWNAYQSASSSGAGASGSSSSLPQSSAAAASSSSARPGYVPAASSSYAQGPAPARSPSPSAATPVVATSSHSASHSAQSAPAGFGSAQASPTAGPATVSRVRALHTFEPTEQGELAFEKGDIIKVVDRNYKDWWRGQLRGRTGIFPVNYVEPLPEPTAMEIAKEAEQEATIFAQAANIDKLLNMLRGLDPAKDNLTDNDEIQELYRSSMSLRPKIVKLIDKYSQKRAELVMMNESFVKARTIFDRMMEESLTRHTGLYDGRLPYQQPATQRVGARPGSQGGQPDYRNSSYIAYDQGGYGFPQPGQPGPAGYAGGAPEPAYAGPPVASPYADPNAAAYPHQPPTYPQPQPYAGQPSVAARPGYSQHPQPTPDPSAYGSPVPGQAQPQASAQAQYQGQSTAQPQPHAQQQPQPQPQAQSQALPQQNGHVEQAEVPQQQPPYIFDPNATYADPNVQAWAQYYAQGGKDLAGAVYFISIPGVTDSQAPAPTAAPATSQQGQPAQAQAQQQDASVQGSAQYSAYNAQQQPANEPIPAYAGPQSAGGAQPGPANISPQIAHATAQPSSSPTRSNTIGASSYHQQPLSPGGAGPSEQQQQQYPPNPYPVQGNGPHPSQSFDGSSHLPYDQHAQYNAQYGQMQGQFGNIGIGGEVAGSSSGIPAAAQTA